MTTLIRPSVRSNIELVIEISGHVWKVDADAGALELALLNLAFNARDAMKEGGTLKIGAATRCSRQARGPQRRICGARVADTGEGMTRRIHGARCSSRSSPPRAFGEGTGLGLSQVFGFVKQIGGAMTVESQPGEGSTFTLYLPASKGAVAGERKLGDGEARGRVLLVEDDSVVAELASGMLNELGFEAVVTHSANEALERLSGERRPTLVFTDIVMPGGISGIELAQKVSDRFPELPILLTTGYSEQVADAHGFPVLQKPYDMDALASALGKVLKLEIAVN